MPFVLLVAADVGGDKRNLEITFPDHVGIAEMESVITEAYTATYPGHPFNLGKMQAYDEDGRKWIDLKSRAVVRDFMQVYAFNRGVQEVQRPIPPPIKPALPASQRREAPQRDGVVAVDDGFVFPTLADDASHEEKVQCCFDEIDANGNRVVEPEEFRRAFRVHSFDFSAATVTDLFAKADHDADGVVAFPEFQRFAEMYPTLIDSLYFRIRDYWEDMRQQQAIQAAQDRLRQHQESERLAHVAHLEAQQATTNQEKRLTAAEQAVSEAVDLEGRAKAHLVDVQRDLEALLRDRAAKKKDLEVVQECERQKVAAHADLQRQADRVEQELAWLEAEQAKAQDKERQALNAVAEAQKEVERALRGVEEADADLEAARAREAQAAAALADEKQQSELANERLKDVEADLAAKVAQQRELQVACQAAMMDIEAERQRRAEDEADLERSRVLEQQAQLAHLEAQRGIEEQEKKMVAIENERQAAIERRRQVEDQERPLLEQEVRLREQRESLEQKELRLRQEASAFHAVRGGRGR